MSEDPHSTRIEMGRRPARDLAFGIALLISRCGSRELFALHDVVPSLAMRD